jgi:hypothetical protein
MLDPEVIIVEEDSNTCNTKLPVVAEILVNPEIEVIVLPSACSVVPNVILSFCNLTFVTLSSAILAVVILPS